MRMGRYGYGEEVWVFGGGGEGKGRIGEYWGFGWIGGDLRRRRRRRRRTKVGEVGGFILF